MGVGGYIQQRAANWDKAVMLDSCSHNLAEAVMAGQLHSALVQLYPNTWYLLGFSWDTCPKAVSSCGWDLHLAKGC